jgi:hypothetical protein
MSEQTSERERLCNALVRIATALDPAPVRWDLLDADAMLRADAESIERLSEGGIDDHPLRQKFCDAIMGVLMYGSNNANPAPAGHWLEQFWQVGNAHYKAVEDKRRADAAEIAALRQRVEACEKQLSEARATIDALRGRCRAAEAYALSLAEKVDEMEAHSEALAHSTPAPVNEEMGE